MEEAQPRERTSWGPILLLVLAVGGSAVGVALYQHLQAAPVPSSDNAGFDLAQTTEARRPTPSPGAAATPAQPPSSLTGASWGSLASKPAGGDPLKSAAQAFADICRANEDRVREMAERYTRSSPVIQAYGKEWMSYPDLKKLNDDYMVQHDPVAFLHGLAQSKNFAHMVGKYAHYPVFMNFVQEAMKIAPPNAREVAMNYIDKDQVATSVMDNVLQSLGMPPGMLGGHAQPQNIDAGKMVNSMLGNALSNPELQKQLGKPNQ